MFRWKSGNEDVQMYMDKSDEVYGVRAVLRLDSNVVIVGGTDTYEDPYQIENPT